MLQDIREKSQGVLAWIIVVLLIATFALWGIHSYISTGKSNVLAYVNHQPITQNEIDASYQRIRQQQQLQLGANYSLNAQTEALLKKQALSQLILSQVLMTEAQKTGYRVTTDQVDRALLQIPAFQQNGQFSLERFHDILSGMLYTQDQFLADMRTTMLISQVQGGYINSAFTLPGEIDQAVKLINQKRDISYLIIPAERFSKNITVLPADIEKYYKQHQQLYQSPEQVSLIYLSLSLKAIKNKLHFDNIKLQQFYETNIQNYTQPVQWHVSAIFLKVPLEASPKQLKDIEWRAQDISDQLKAGGDFSLLAEKYSEDNISAKNGGELNWFSAGTLDPVFEKAAASLQKPGNISEPVKTGYGYCIIKLLGQKKAKVLSYESVKSQVESALAEKQAEQIFAEDSDKLQNLTYANPDSLDVAAKALNLPIQTTGLFGRQGEKKGIAAHLKVVNTAFSNDLLKQNNNSELIQIDPDTVIVFRIKEHKPASILPLADVQHEIQTKLRHDMAEKDVQMQGDVFIQQLRKNYQNNNAALSQWAKRYNLMLQTDNSAGRYDTKVDAVILNHAFKMPHPSKLSLEGLTLPSGDYAIIIVNAVHDGLPPKNANIQRRIFQEEIESNYGHLDYQFYVRELMKKAKIKFEQNTPENVDTQPGNTDNSPVNNNPASLPPAAS